MQFNDLRAAGPAIGTDARRINRRNPLSTKTVLIFCGALVIALGSAGCDQKVSKRAATAAAPVRTAEVTNKTVPLTLDAIGAVEPSRTASVRSQVTGILQKISFHEGDDVDAGDLLFEIDPRPFQIALRSAQADLERARAQLDNARSQSERYRTLNSESAISKEQFQSIEVNERTAAAQVLSDEAAVANAQLQLEYCSIHAPVPGRTGSFGAHEGDLISSGSSTSLVVINQLSPTYVTFSVPQQYLSEMAKYRAAGPVRVTASPSSGNDSMHEEGTLTFIDNAVDSTTGTVRLKATFPNTAKILWPGQFVTVRLTLSSPVVIAIPSSAVQSDQQGQHVFVIKPDRTAEFRPITIERTIGGDAVISKGLNVGEIVVTDGQLRVVAGKAVEIKTPQPDGQTVNVAPANAAKPARQSP